MCLSRDVVLSDAEIGQLLEVADLLADLPDAVEAQVDGGQAR